MRDNWIASLGVVVAVLGGGLVAWAMLQELGGRGAGGERPAPDALLLGFALLILAVCLGTAWLVLFGRLVTEVGADGLSVQLRPLTRRHLFAWDEIASAEACSYEPIAEYGGWGVRRGRDGRAYNVSGNRGVRLVLRGGERVLVGSRRAERLVEAMRRYAPGAPG